MEHPESEAEREPMTAHVHEERHVVAGGPAAPPDTAEVTSSDNPGWRAVQLVYLAFGVIDGLLLIRLVLKLLGANPHAGFASWLYSFTDIFMGPFRNLLPAVGNEQSILEMSVLIAILVYALAGWAIGRLVDILFFRSVTVSRRTGRIRPGPY